MAEATADLRKFMLIAGDPERFEQPRFGLSTKQVVLSRSRGETATLQHAPAEQGASGGDRIVVRFHWTGSTGQQLSFPEVGAL